MEKKINLKDIIPCCEDMKYFINHQTTSCPQDIVGDQCPFCKKELKVEDKEMIQFITWKKGIMGFYLAYTGSSLFLNRSGYYCGYCIFPKRPLIERKHDGLLRYVSVHGGITYCQKDKDGTFIYGFDCAHAGDGANPNLYNIDWLKRECERMAKEIEIARKYEKKYLLAYTDKEREMVVQKYLDATRHINKASALVL